jgi:hypothetical protein
MCRYVDVRLAGCFVLEQVMGAAGQGFSQEQRRAVYPELLKRLDDSSNQVGMRCWYCYWSAYAGAYVSNGLVLWVCWHHTVHLELLKQVDGSSNHVSHAHNMLLLVYVALLAFSPIPSILAAIAAAVYCSPMGLVHKVPRPPITPHPEVRIASCHTLVACCTATELRDLITLPPFFPHLSCSGPHCRMSHAGGILHLHGRFLLRHQQRLPGTGRRHPHGRF